MKKNFSLLFVNFMMACTLVGCGNDNNVDIVGKWCGNSDIENVEFKSDGTLTMTSKGASFNGTYEIEENQMSWKTQENGVSFNPVFNFKIEGNELLLTRVGHNFEYHFVKAE